MDAFKERQQAFEQKFKMDQDLQFKVNIRAVKAFGLWAAEQLGMSGDDAFCYADSVVDADFEEPGVEDVFRKVRSDFENRGLNINDDEMRGTFDEKLAGVKHEMAEELSA